ncbi:MAG: hypothetical protein NC418_06305 [Muribaculaceae bacterium]|nr:hypothetical protein [Muribaculaceae bacterium]
MKKHTNTKILALLTIICFCISACEVNRFRITDPIKFKLVTDTFYMARYVDGCHFSSFDTIVSKPQVNANSEKKFIKELKKICPAISLETDTVIVMSTFYMKDLTIETYIKCNKETIVRFDTSTGKTDSIFSIDSLLISDDPVTIMEGRFLQSVFDYDIANFKGMIQEYPIFYSETDYYTIFIFMVVENGLIVKKEQYRAIIPTWALKLFFPNMYAPKDSVMQMLLTTSAPLITTTSLR